MKIINDAKDIFMEAMKGYVDYTHEDVCILEAPLLGTKSFINKDGSLTTVIAVNGAFQMMGGKQFENFSRHIDQRLSGAIQSPGRIIEVSFNKDNFRTKNKLRESLRNSWKKNDAGFDLSAILSQQEEVMATCVSYEQAYISLTTTTDVLPKANAKRAKTKARDAFRDAVKNHMEGSNASNAQIPKLYIKDIYNKHNSFVETVCNIFNEYLDIEVLDHHQAISEMRSFFYPESTSVYFKAKVLGNNAAISAYGNGMITSSDTYGAKNDISNLMSKSLCDEIFVSDAEIDDDFCKQTGHSGMVKFGDKYYAPVIMSSPPERHTRFDELMSSIDFSIPFRMTISAETGKSKFLSKIKRTLGTARMLYLTNSGENGVIIDAAKDLIEGYGNGEDTPLNMYTTFLTWGRTPEEAGRNRDSIISAVQSWGSADAVAEYGNPYVSSMSTIPGFTRKRTAPGLIQKLSEFITVLPFTRASSPWDTGSLMFYTRENKMWNYEIGSSKQQTWIELISAGPGSGKSVWMAASNLSMIMNTQKDLLPKIGILDIGDSSKYMIDFIKSLAPESLKNEFSSHRIKFTKEFAINPFDTVLGARKPLSFDRGFLNNFLSLVLTPVDVSSEQPLKFLTEFINVLVDESYTYFDPDLSPDTAKRYEKYQIEGLDEIIEQHGLPVYEQKTFLYDIVDMLMELEEYHLAKRTQAYAVPRLDYLPAVINSSKMIKDQYANSDTKEKVELVDIIQGQINYASSQYELLTYPTAFDVSTASVVSLDLAEVAQGTATTRKAKRENSIAYMLGRYMIGKSYYRHLDDLNESGVIPEKHKEYHRAVLNKERSRIKRLCMDEFHVTSGAEGGIVEQVESDMRLGRKYNVVVTLASQIDSDFTQVMHDVATTKMIMGGGSDSLRDKQKEIYDLEDDTYQALKSYVSSPSEKGSSMIIFGNSKKKAFSQMVYYKPAPIMIWGVSTTPEDILLRDYVKGQEETEIMGLYKVSKAFPMGSAKHEFERIMKNEDVEVPKGSNLSIEVAKRIYRNKVKNIPVNNT